MLFDIRELITKVEYLGLDTQPLRDLYHISFEIKFSFDPFMHILTTLQNQLNKQLPPNSQPMAISLLLKQLDKKVQTVDFDEEKRSKQHSSGTIGIEADEIKSLIVDTVRSLNGHAVQSNQQLIDAIKTLDSSVKTIKRTDHFTEQKEVYDQELSKVFVNPIDEEKVKSMKSNVSIGTKKGSSIKDKVKRLKNLSKTK